MLLINKKFVTVLVYPLTIEYCPSAFTVDIFFDVSSVM